MWKFFRAARRTKVLLACLCGALAMQLGSCAMEEQTRENYNTELVIVRPVGGESTVEVGKRVRFSANPDDARAVTIQSASLHVTSPEGMDFAFLDTLEVYVRDLADNRVLVATSPVFEPGVTEVNMRIEFPDDLKPFVEESRVRLLFIARLSRWFSDWPVDGITIEAHVVLDFEIF